MFMSRYRSLVSLVIRLLLRQVSKHQVSAERWQKIMLMPRDVDCAGLYSPDAVTTWVSVVK